MADPTIYAHLWLPVPKWQTFTYRIPQDWEDVPAPGSLVLAPLGRRKTVGMVAELTQDPPEGLGGLKDLIEPLPEECTFEPKLLELLRWAKGHYLTPPGEVLRTFLPSALLKGKMGKGQRAQNVEGLTEFHQAAPPQLTEEQMVAVARVTAQWGKFFPCLLQGVTGSGKTEVYLKLCEEVLRQKGSALILVPEIALTPQILGRFSGRFSSQVAAYHSGMTEGQRLKVWWGAKAGKIPIVVGTRSAVALPLKDLALLVVDEEHDPSYKQEERFRYHGRDLAVVRAKLQGIPILLGSATPSVETQENVHQGKYHRLTLHARATQSPLPQIHLIDIKENPLHPETLLSDPLQEALRQTLERGEQALFFLNRRGYAPFILCQDCGGVFRCPNCEISLTYHRRPPLLRCHYCEYQQEVPEICPTCEGRELRPIGAGTERLEEGFVQTFPGIRLGRLDRDIVASRRRTEELLSKFSRGELDVLIGTQLVTKGHDFRNLTLVGILLADLTLNVPEFRAAERGFQIVTQVAGRAGRHDLPGQVYLQTFRPDHYAIQAALKQNSEEFFVQERSFRKGAGYPPFRRVILFRFLGSQDARVREGSHRAGDFLKTLFRRFKNVQVLGPTKSTLEKLRGQYRYQVLLKSEGFEAMRRVLEERIPRLENQMPSGVRMGIDVDPLGVF